MAHLLIAAPHKSSGKTTVTLGLCAALAGRGRRIQPFKKGPDYIDPMWLGLATGLPCYNLDPQLMSPEEIRELFARHAAPADIAVIEGNMGLFDSIDVEGEHSNAALAALLGAPVVLVADARGMTRSVVPLLMGFMQFDPRIRIAGVILNNVAGARHEIRLREAIGHYMTLPVLGAIHRDPRLALDERHLGLIPSNEAEEAQRQLDTIATRIAAQVDLEAIEEVAASAPSFASVEKAPTKVPVPVRIGIARDRAFGFYYPDDQEALEAAGAELVPVDMIHDVALPTLDGLFIGGGFPETQMEALEANHAMRQALRAAIENGLPVYAECGGLMYLTRSIRWGERRAEMVGVIPADTVMTGHPVGRGYTRLRETGVAPWSCRSEPGASFDAHEFHYSHLENLDDGVRFAYQVERGAGIDGRHDGIVYKNLLANYAHLRSVGDCHWARSFVAFVRQRREERRSAETL